MKSPKITNVFNDTENHVKIKMPRQIGQNVVSDKELVSDINYQKDKIKRGKVRQLHICIQDLKGLTCI